MLLTLKDQERDSARAAAVTVVIPTRRRPQLLRAAILSALRQNEVMAEILVVIDGPPDSESEEMVRSFRHPRVRFHAMERNHGPALCRNRGAQLATTEWVAFLDDDDSWLPDKLARQFAALKHHEARAKDRRVIVSCQSYVDTPGGVYIWPRRAPAENQRLGDYLFCRRSLFKGESFAQSSSFLFPRALIADVPQRPVAHEDWDWALRACEQYGYKFHVVERPLVRHVAEHQRNSLSNMHLYRRSFRWCLAMRRLLSPEAFAGLLLQTVNGALTETGDWRAARRNLAIAWRYGRPRFFDLAIFFCQWAMPVAMRRRLRAAFTRSDV